jgi:hypothetical protein
MIPASNLYRRKRPGMTLLITVLIAGAVALAIGLSVTLRAIGELDISTAGSESEIAQGAMDACVQEGLLKLARDSSYAGDTLPMGEATCTVTVTTSGTTRHIAVSADSDRWTRALRVSAVLTSTGVTITQTKLTE